MFIIWPNKKAKDRTKTEIILFASLHGLKHLTGFLLSVVSSSNVDSSSLSFFLRDSRASETQARVKITPREKRRHAAGREKNEGLQTKPKLLTLHGRLIFLSPRRVSPFLAWGDFHARSRFARSTIPEGKWGTIRSLVQTGQK